MIARRECAGGGGGRYENKWARKYNLMSDNLVKKVLPLPRPPHLSDSLLAGRF